MNKRLLCKVLAFSFVLLAFIALTTTAAFAGTSKDKVTVRYFCSGMGTVDAYYDSLEVKSDLFEKYFPEVAIYEPKGASYMDALTAATIRKYGSAKYLKVHDNDTYAWVAECFGKEMLGAIVNGVAITSVHNEIKNGDFVATLVYSDGDWHGKLGSVFDKNKYSVIVGKPLTVTVKGMSIMSRTKHDMNSAMLQRINIKTGTAEDASDIQFKNGKFTMKFPKVGKYYISAYGTTTYSDNEGTYEDADTFGAFAEINVKDIVPGKPTIKSAKRNSKTKGTVKWKKTSYAKKYEVAYRIKGAGKWSVKKTTKTSVTLKLKAKKAYQVKVRAVNGTSSSAYSKTSTIKKK